MDTLGFLNRGILKMARTISEIEGQEHVQPAHLSEAIPYRSLDKDLIA